MSGNPNDVEEDVTRVRSSILIDAWMEARIATIARRTFSTRSQVIRQLIAKGLEDEMFEEPAEAAS